MVLCKPKKRKIGKRVMEDVGIYLIFPLLYCVDAINCEKNIYRILSFLSFPSFSHVRSDRPLTTANSVCNIGGGEERG